MLTGALLAHTGEPPGPHDLWGAWSVEPLVVVPLLLAAWAYARGARAGGSTRRARCFAGGLVAVAVALLTPLDAASASLASAHMVQHVLLVLVAAPLLALAAPGTRLLRGSTPGVRAAAGRLRVRWRGAVDLLHHPAVAFALHAVALWAWHGSGPYDAALAVEAVHVAEHATFLATALLFWRVALGGRPGHRVDHGLGIVLVFGAALSSTFLAALLTFAGTPWYSAYAGTTAAWGLTPLADQQLAGVLMWVPAGFAYPVAGLALLAAWIRSGDRPALAPAAT